MSSLEQSVAEAADVILRDGGRFGYVGVKNQGQAGWRP